MNISALRAGLMTVSAYKNLLDTPVMGEAAWLLSALAEGEGEAALNAYTGLFYALKDGGFAGLGDFLADALRWDNGPYPRPVSYTHLSCGSGLFPF